jgi:hypothetical protein
MAAADLHPDSAQLEAFALGSLDGDLLAAVEVHVAVCPACQRRAAAASGDSVVELLRRAHTRIAHPSDTWAEWARPAQTPALSAPAAATLGPAASSSTDHGEAVPSELARHARYRIVGLLGEGGMGSVYEAEHRVMQRPVALKVISRAYTASDTAVERFRREVRAAARLVHPNIVTAYDAENAGATHFLVMEYVEGVTLARLVKERGPLPVAEACGYVRQAALGLQHAHERGMVHRDVKPANLIRCTDGTVKVLDFGLATLTAERGEGLTEENVVMGTPDYLAPEQAKDARSADIRADVYSLGCTLYYLLTGNVPYPAPTLLQKVLAHRELPLPSLRQACPAAPPGLAKVLARLLAKKPEDRYPTPAVVAAALEPFTQAAADPPRRRRSLLVAMALAVLLGGLVLAGGVVYRIQTDKGELVITTQTDDVKVVITQGGKLVDVIDTKTDKQITLALRSGVYELELKGAPTGLKLSIDKATLTRGETVLAKIERLKSKPEEMPTKVDHPVTPQSLEVARRLPWPGRHNLSTSFSEDSQLCMAFARSSDAFRVWETETGKLVQAVDGLPPTATVRFLPDGKQLLSSHTDGTCRRCDLTTGYVLGQTRIAPGWPLIQDITPEGDAFVTFSWPSTHAGGLVQVWDLKKSMERFRVEPVRDGAKVLACAPLSPDGKRLLTVDNLGPEGSIVRIFQVSTGEQLLAKSIKLNAGTVQTWSADSRRICIVGADPELNASVVACLDAGTGEIISKVELVLEVRRGSQGQAFSRDTRYLALQFPDASMTQLYNVRTGKLVGRVSGPTAGFSLSFSPNGRYVACGGQGEVVVYRLPELPAKDKR